MTTRIEDVYDRLRLCGWRHEGGLYLTAPKLVPSCGMLPQRLGECPCCGLKIKVTRGLQKVNVKKLFEDSRCTYPGEKCTTCLINRIGVGYMIGVGAKFYPSRDAYLREAMEMGISKRIAQIPHGFRAGQSAVLLAHPKVFLDLETEKAEPEPVGIEEDDEQAALPMIYDSARSTTTGKRKAVWTPAVIAIFVPQRIEYIVRGDETDFFLEGLVERGITPVRVHRTEDAQLAIEK